MIINISNLRDGVLFCECNCRFVCKLDTLGKEILSIAIPAVLTLAADPVASLIDTMFIGRLGRSASLLMYINLKLVI